MNKPEPREPRKYETPSTEWEPASNGYIDGLIELAEYEMDKKSLALWEKIKLPQPEKWTQHPLGDLGGGFWVVAVMGKTCIYYNDIEDGFNSSKFNSWGEIDEYRCSQIELHQKISGLLS